VVPVLVVVPVAVTDVAVGLGGKSGAGRAAPAEALGGSWAVLAEGVVAGAVVV
jgi:hypothetical protein